MVVTSAAHSAGYWVALTALRKAVVMVVLMVAYSVARLVDCLAVPTVSIAVADWVECSVA